MRVHLEPRYLIPESFALVGRLLKNEPVWTVLSILGIFGVVLWVLQRIFRRGVGDVFLFAVIISTILIVLASALHNFIHVQGYTFGG